MPSTSDASMGGAVISVTLLLLGHYIFPKAGWMKRSWILILAFALIAGIGSLLPAPFGPTVAAAGQGGAGAQVAIWFVFICFLLMVANAENDESEDNKGQS